MEYPEDRSARNVELEYFLGDSLLVVPVFDQEDEIDVYLPNGQWIDLFTHERIKGGRWVKRKIELDKIPVFIRQNKMIPMLTKIPENIEEKYENLDVILFCEDEIRDTYIDDGNVQNLKAKICENGIVCEMDKVNAIVDKMKNRKIDALFFPFCDFGEEQVVAAIASKFTVPILIWGPRDERPNTDEARGRDTQCGMFAATKVLQRYGLKYSYSFSRR